MEKQKPGQYQRFHHATVDTALSDLGLTKTQSHRWQTMATLAEDALEHYLATANEQDADITSVGIYRLAKDQQRAARKTAIQSQAQETCTVTDLQALIQARPWSRLDLWTIWLRSRGELRPPS